MPLLITLTPDEKESLASLGRGYHGKAFRRYAMRVLEAFGDIEKIPDGKMEIYREAKAMARLHFVEIIDQLASSKPGKDKDSWLNE